jgi:hypothetical protein
LKHTAAVLFCFLNPNAASPKLVLHVAPITDAVLQPTSLASSKELQEDSFGRIILAPELSLLTGLSSVACRLWL